MNRRHATDSGEGAAGHGFVQIKAGRTVGGHERLCTENGGENAAGHDDIGHGNVFIKYKYTYVCMYICIYIYIYTYTYIHIYMYI